MSCSAKKGGEKKRKGVGGFPAEFPKVLGLHILVCRGKEEGEIP